MDALRQYLVNLPLNLGYRDDKKVKVNVYKALYFAITGEGKFMDLLFYDIPKDELVALENYSWPPKLNRTRPFYKSFARHQYTHPPDQICGRLLKKGEPVYRCSDCGYDDTCVLCVHCFNKEDHIDHNVSVYVTSGESSGLCDCGDDKAFTAKLNCACQNIIGYSEELDEGFKRAMKQTLTVVLNYILDVTNVSINTLPFIHQNINDRGGLKLTSKQISDIGSLPSYAYGADDVNSDGIWYLVLWNDENHDYLEAKTGIRAATGVNDRRAKEIADEINEIGRAILKVSPSYTDLLKTQKLAEADGLVATIMTARDYMRELIVLHMFGWISNILDFPGNSHFRDEAKRLLAELFLEPDFLFSRVLPAELFKSSSLEVKQACFRNGLLYNGELLNMALTKLKPGVSTSSLMKPIRDLLRPDLEPKMANSRLQYLLAFEIRLFSEVRRKLKTTVFPVLLSDPITKATFCEQYVDVYPILLTVMAHSDREEQLSSISDISVQLLTCPRTNMWIMKSGKLGNIFGPLCTLIEEHSSKMNDESGYPRIVEIVVDVRSRREKSSIQKAITDCINDIGRIIGKNDSPDLLNLIAHHDNLVFFLLFQKYFQGSSSITRKYGDHVERELMTEVYLFLQRSLPVLNIVRNATHVRDVDSKMVAKGVSLVLEFLFLRKIKLSAPKIADFRVSKEPVSFTNPINSFLSYMLQNCGVDELHTVFANTRLPFMHVSDFSLRSIVLASQVKIGFWIRNGAPVSRLAAFYTDSFMGELTYFRDFHLNQVAAIFDDPKLTLYNFLDRWELLMWYAGDVDYTKTVYEDRFSFICEQFIIFMYNLLTDRFYFGSTASQEAKKYRVRQGICYALCDEPKAYSPLIAELGQRIGEIDLGQGLVDLPEFDDILRECSDYQAPTGLTDFGVYRLKPHIFEKLDPLSLHLDSSRFLSVSESLISNIAKNRGIDESKVVLIPEIYNCESSFVNEHIGMITKTKEFAKLVYKLLQVALDSQEEIFLPQLLHLIHAVIMDDDLLHGENYLNESFVTIPISDLLLTIVESKMSKNIILKADFLLDQFVSRDKRIVDSLIDCFGEAHVQSYKKRKIGLFETDVEKRKRQAEERKAKVMRKFARQREKFIKQNNLEDERLQTDSIEDGADDLLRRCVACGESENTEELFGILFCNTKSSIFWKVPGFNIPYTQMAFGDLDKRLTAPPDLVYPRGYPYEFLGSEPSRYKLTATVGSTCAHGMHFGCYKRSQNQLKHFPCPLCHNLHDSFLPSFLPNTSSPFVSEEYLLGDLGLGKYNRIIYSSGKEKSSSLVKSSLNEEYFSANGIIHADILKHIATDFLPCLQSGLTVDVFLDGFCGLSLLIADTIRATEISTRLDGQESLSTFLEQIPPSTVTMLRSLSQCRALIYHYRLLAYLCGSNDDKTDKFAKYWEKPLNVDGAFNEVVALFFQTDESLKTLIRMGFAKLIATVTFELAGTFWLPAYAQVTFDKVLDPETLKNFKQFVSNSNHDTKSEFSDDALVRLFFCLERCLLPFLRQCVIFWDVLTSTKIELNVYESLERFSTLRARIEDQEHLDSADALCEILQIPHLKDFVNGIVNSESNFQFEASVLDVILNAKIPDQLLLGITNIQYPGVVRLIDLPDDYNACITDTKYKVPGFTFGSVCLQCGRYLHPSEHLTHIEECSYMPIYFCPRVNNLNIVIHIGGNPFEVKIPAPYLTVHGEVKREKAPGKAILNKFRYNYLNKLWLNQGLFGFITRTLFGARDTPGATAVPATGLDNIFDDDDEEEDSDDEFGEQLFWD